MKEIIVNSQSGISKETHKYVSYDVVQEACHPSLLSFPLRKTAVNIPELS